MKKTGAKGTQTHCSKPTATPQQENRQRRIQPQHPRKTPAQPNNGSIDLRTCLVQRFCFGAARLVPLVCPCMSFICPTARAKKGVGVMVRFNTMSVRGGKHFHTNKLQTSVSLSCVVSLFLLLYTPTGTTIIGFFKHVLRYEYGTFVLHPDMISHESAWERTWIYLRHISTQTSHRFMFTGTAVDSTMTFDPANSVSFTPLSGSNWIMYTIILIGVVHSCLTSIGGRVLLLLLASYLLCFHSLSNLDLTTELTFGKGTCR